MVAIVIRASGDATTVERSEACNSTRIGSKVYRRDHVANAEIALPMSCVSIYLAMEESTPRHCKGVCDTQERLSQSNLDDSRHHC